MPQHAELVPSVVDFTNLVLNTNSSASRQHVPPLIEAESVPFFLIASFVPATNAVAHKGVSVAPRLEDTISRMCKDDLHIA